MPVLGLVTQGVSLFLFNTSKMQSFHFLLFVGFAYANTTILFNVSEHQVHSFCCICHSVNVHFRESLLTVALVEQGYKYSKADDVSNPHPVYPKRCYLV